MNEQFKKDLEESRFLSRPLREHPENGGRSRWLRKPVLKSCKLPLTEQFDKLLLHGPAAKSLNSAVTRNGCGSICIESATTLPEKNPTNRYYDITVLTVPIEPQDFSAYNRFSLWVYLEAPCFESVMLQFALLNEGEHVLPEPGRFVGIHHEQVIPGEWYHVIWEVPELPRDRITGFTVQIPVCGRLPGGDETIRAYIEDPCMELVEAENAHGFGLRKNSIAYCHSGYIPSACKQALIENCSASSFRLENEAGETVYEGSLTQAPAGFPLPAGERGENSVISTDSFRLLDFTDFQKPGCYRLICGTQSSGYFDIGQDAFLPLAWKALNFFACERCGVEVPGIHAACHLDLMCRHPDGRMIPAYGGWHDGADLTLGTVGTAKHILSMLELAESIRETASDLYDRLLQEIRFGLDFLIRTRFGDGYRFGGSIVGIWTDNIRGDFDDITVDAEKDPVMNLLAAAACVKAVPHFETDPVLIHSLVKAAREDFFFALKELRTGISFRQEASDHARIALCALECYRYFKDDEMLTCAVESASIVHACQELTPQKAFTLPLRGYFYETRARKRILNFFHQSNEHELTECFIRLLETVPEHPDAADWQLSVEASAEYYRTVSSVTEPYGVLPAGLYELDNTDYSKIYHEGAKVGLPSMEEYNAEVSNGIPMTERIYLRRFPVAYQFRGFNVTVSSKAKAVLLLSKYFNDRSFYDIGLRQLEYILGRNPFAMSTVYGEGYDYPPLYAGFLGNVVGSAPVGIETFENEDAPYMPMQNNCTYKEVWSHADGFLMELLALCFPCRFS